MGKIYGKRKFKGPTSKGKRRATGKPVSQKTANHVRQFGELHPAEDASLGEWKGAKAMKFHDTVKAQPDTRREDSSESEDEVEETPYEELLKEFSTGKGGKKNITVLSDSEESLGEEDGEGEEEEEEEDEEEDEEKDEEVEEEDEEIDGIENEDESDKLEECEDNKSIEDDSNEEGKSNNDCSDDEPELEDETVIGEVQLDQEENLKWLHLDSDDPFIKHYESELSEGFRSKLKEGAPLMKENLVFNALDNVLYKRSKIDEHQNMTNPNSSSLGILATGEISRNIVSKPPKVNFEIGEKCLEKLYLKPQILERVKKQKKNIDTSEVFNGMQSEILNVVGNYVDLHFPERTLENGEMIRSVYCVHIANHILKTRTRIIHHNGKLVNKVDVPESYRDQGFVRPKVLILAPFKDSALRIVKTLIELLIDEDKGNVANKKRFSDEYGGSTLFMPKTNPKPPDYEALFSGNIDDNFKIGLALTKKSIKLYTEFYSSDIIISSPVGIRMIIGAEGERDRDYDFLSSIEVLVIDQADVCLMQNWEHVLHIMKHLNLQPVTTHGTDFSRIRPWSLDGLAKFYRQTIVFSSTFCAEINGLLSRYSRNYKGQVIVNNPKSLGDVRLVLSQLPQIFHRFDCNNLKDSEDSRFEYFVKKILPNFKERLMSHTMIFVSSYFDFVKLRNYFKKEDVSFLQICEYTTDKKIARARDLFFHGKNHFLLYTERAHFFRRFRLKGIGHVIFYQVPLNSHFYSEICNFIQENNQSKRVRMRRNSSVTILYNKYDGLRLIPIVGNSRASTMLSSSKSVHAIMTEC